MLLPRRFGPDRLSFYRMLSGGAVVVAVAVSATGAALLLAVAGLPVGPLVLALLLGLVVRALWPACEGLAGVTGIGRVSLRAGVAVLGLGVSVQEAVRIGWQGGLLVAVSLAVTLLVTLWAGRWLKVAPGLTRLIAAGTAVCGASAVLAVAARQTPTETARGDAALAIAIVTLFGSIGMIAVPLLAPLLGLDPWHGGLWAGASLHEVAHAVAAAMQQGALAGDIGTIAKLERVALLVPVVMLLGDGRRGMPPLFLLVFLGLMGLSSLGLVPSQVQALARPVSGLLLTLALAALGLGTALGPLRRAGWRPLLLGLVASLLISLFSLGLIRGFLGE